MASPTTRYRPLNWSDEADDQHKQGTEDAQHGDNRRGRPALGIGIADDSPHSNEDAFDLPRR
jgi:hypothetical protein